MPANDDPESEDDEGYVIVSFDIFTPVEIEPLRLFQRKRAHPAAEFIYDFGTITFDEGNWERKADRLRTTINDFIDKVDEVPRTILNAPETFVRLFMTLPRGAETLDSQTIKRLAEVNATIWIDA